MARVNFNDAATNSGGESEFFKLEDGQVARVQFLISTPDDIPTYYAHHIDVEGFQYGKDVQCNRTDYEDCDCELCKMGIRRSTLCMVLMYDLDDQKIKLWQRSKKWVSDKIIPLLNRYDLKNTVVEIERHGKKLDTTYNLFAMPDAESEDVSELEIPDNFDFVILKKSNEDILTWRDTGEFPKVDSEDKDDEHVSRRSISEEPVSRRGGSTSSRRGGRFNVKN